MWHQIELVSMMNMKPVFFISTRGNNYMKHLLVVQLQCIVTPLLERYDLKPNPAVQLQRVFITSVRSNLVELSSQNLSLSPLVQC